MTELLRSGVYGDVSRVKIMFNKKDTALVQFADARQAHIGKHSTVRQLNPFQLKLYLVEALIFTKYDFGSCKGNRQTLLKTVDFAFFWLLPDSRGPL